MIDYYDWFIHIRRERGWPRVGFDAITPAIYCRLSKQSFSYLKSRGEREREREKGDNEKCCWWCCCCCWCCWRPVAKRQDAETLKREKMKKENFCSLSWFFWRIFFLCCCCCCCCCLFLLLLRRLLLLLLLFLLVSIASRRSLPAASRPLTKTNGKSREASARQFIYSSAFLSLSFSFSLVNKYTRDKHCGRPRNSTRIANDRI